MVYLLNKERNTKSIVFTKTRLGA